jgi:hypothetical protein
LVTDPLDQPVQHIDGGTRIIERPVGWGGGGAEQPRQCGQPHAGRLVTGEDPAREPDRAQHRRSGPGYLAALGRRLQEPDVEAGVMRDQYCAAGELEKCRQHRFDRRRVVDHR